MKFMRPTLFKRNILFLDSHMITKQKQKTLVSDTRHPHPFTFSSGSALSKIKTVNTSESLLHIFLLQYLIFCNRVSYTKKFV